MASILIASPDPKAIAEVEHIAELLKIRSRSVSALSKAREWLSMQGFDALLVDSRYGEGTSLDLVTFAWKHHPLMVGALYNFEGPVEDEWPARLAGARVFSGAHAVDETRFMLGSLEDRRKVTPFPILLVEDLDSPRNIVASYIEILGYPQIEGVESVDKAIELLKTKPEFFGCLITDYNMPRRKGAELIEEVRSSKELSHLPIIVLTAYATPENLVECVRAGATGFLVKPFKKKSLRAELEKAMRILFNKQNPRLCEPGQAELLKHVLLAIGLV